MPFKQLLLSSDDDNFERLQKVITERIQEGFGEAVFDLGYENNGESCNFTKEEWDNAYKRLDQAAQKVRANSHLLMTKNIGGDLEAASTAASTSKDKSCSGKVLIRQVPQTIESVIETRIAVVGNGMSHATQVGLV